MVLVLSAASVASGPSDQQAVLESAATAIGASAIDTIEVTGRGSDFLFGQAYDGPSAWPRFNLPRYVLWIDYRVPASREERTRTQAQSPPLGGGNQPIGEQRQVWSVSGTWAWNGDGASASLAGRERDHRPSAEARLTQLWMTPHGFVKGALAAGAAVRQLEGEPRRTLVTYTTPTGVRLQGTIDGAGLVRHVETQVGTPVLGDVVLEVDFSDYAAFGPVRFPRRIVQREAGYPVLDLRVTDVRPNAAGRAEPPATLREASAASVTSVAQPLAPGVWSIPLGPRDRSVAVEFADHVVVIEAPDGEDVSAAALAAIRAAIPAKPVRYVINTHTHFDHSGGLRTYAAAGARIVTHQDNVAYYRQAFAAPRTIHPDALWRSGLEAQFEGIVGSRTFVDETQRLVVYHYPGNMHHPGMLMVHLPRQRILVEADSFNPPNTPGDPPNAVPNLVHFYETVERLLLDVDRIVPLHGRVTTWDEARRAVDTYGAAQPWPSSLDRSIR